MQSKPVAFCAAGVADEKTPSWGVTPVPERMRVLGLLDTFLLWTNLGISLLVLVAASYFGLSLKQALLATLLGGLIGNGMLALAGLIGADARVPTMVLQRAPLGPRCSVRSGSYDGSCGRSGSGPSPRPCCTSASGSSTTAGSARCGIRAARAA